MTSSNRRSWLTIGVIFAVAAVLAGVLIAVNASSGDDTPTGSRSSNNVGLLDGDEAAKLVKNVEQYYAAVRAGDAAKALSYGAPVSDRRLLTDKVLRAQQSLGRIDKVRVDPDVLRLKDRVLVDVALTVGGKAYQDSIRFTRAGSGWQMPVAAEIGADYPGSSSYSLLGVPISAGAKAYVFPGPVRATATSPYITVTAGGTDVAPVPGVSDAFDDRKIRLSTAGTSAVRAAVQRAMVTCAASRKLRPDDNDCPNYTISAAGPEIANSVRWVAPTDYAPLTIDDSLGLALDRVSVNGAVQFQVSYRVGSGKQARTVSEKVTARLIGTVDLTASPATYTG